MKFGKKAIIVYWDDIDDRHLERYKNNLFVTFFSSRWGMKRIKDTLKSIYLQRYPFSPEEVLAHTTRTRKNLPTLELHNFNDGKLRIGFKPWLVAADAEDIKIVQYEDYCDIFWTELTYKPKDGMPAEVVKTSKHIKQY